MMNLHWFDFVGFLGVSIVLGAYAGQQARRLNGDGVLYSLLNMIGAAGILVPVWKAAQLNWSVFFIEAAWVAISIYGIYHALARRLLKAKS